MNKSPEQLALEYPQLKADIDLCYEQLFEICRGERKKSAMSIPHQKTDFDMQFSAAFDELKAYRENKSIVEVVRCGECIYWAQCPTDKGMTCTGPMAYACTPADFYCGGAKPKPEAVSK